MTTTTVSTVRLPESPGREMAALRRFHRDVTWTGTIVEGGMGPGTPAMTARGSGTHRTIQDGRWIVGDYRQEQFLADDTPVLTWQLHWVAGWDPAAGTYRATVADCYGHADVLTGRLDGDRLVFESAAGAPVRIRLTWDVSDPENMLWRNETSADGGPWSVVEEYHCHPIPAHRRSPTAERARHVAARALNPVMMRYAGRRHWYAARLEHVGRRSGRSYATPVVAVPVPTGLAVPLPYGPGVDWHRNLEAAGRAVLAVHGTRYRVSSPRTVPAAEVLGALPRYWRAVLGGIAEFVLVSAEAIDEPERPDS